MKMSRELNSDLHATTRLFMGITIRAKKKKRESERERESKKKQERVRK